MEEDPENNKSHNLIEGPGIRRATENIPVGEYLNAPTEGNLNDGHTGEGGPLRIVSAETATGYQTPIYGNLAYRSWADDTEDTKEVDLDDG